jgi:hypothetical protein
LLYSRHCGEAKPTKQSPAPGDRFGLPRTPRDNGGRRTVASAVPVNYHAARPAPQEVKMTDDTAPNADQMRLLAELRGLGRTLEKFPDAVTTAFVRGRRPIGSFPEKFSPVTEPAGRFAADPERGE